MFKISRWFVELCKTLDQPLGILDSIYQFTEHGSRGSWLDLEESSWFVTLECKDRVQRRSRSSGNEAMKGEKKSVAEVKTRQKNQEAQTRGERRNNRFVHDWQRLLEVRKRIVNRKKVLYYRYNIGMMSLWHVSSLNVRSTRITSFLSYVLAIQALIVVASVKIFIEKKNVEIEKNIYMYKKKKRKKQNEVQWRKEKKERKNVPFNVAFRFTHTYTHIHFHSLSLSLSRTFSYFPFKTYARETST